MGGFLITRVVNDVFSVPRADKFWSYGLGAVFLDAMLGEILPVFRSFGWFYRQLRDRVRALRLPGRLLNTNVGSRDRRLKDGGTLICTNRH